MWNTKLFKRKRTYYSKSNSIERIGSIKNIRSLYESIIIASIEWKSFARINK